MLQVRVLTNRKFLIATIIVMLVQGALLAGGILIPILLQSYMGFSATTSGLVLLPGAIVMGAMGPVAGRLFDKHGPRVLAVIGTGVLALPRSCSWDRVWGSSRSRSSIRCACSACRS